MAALAVGWRISSNVTPICKLRVPLSFFFVAFFFILEMAMCREAVRSGKSDAESFLSERQRKAIGNLGGQSTSNNVSVSPNNNLSVRVYLMRTRYTAVQHQA